MLSKAENELLVNTDRGTPMGELFRRFWLPVALSDDLPGPVSAPDDGPVVELQELVRHTGKQRVGPQLGKRDKIVCWFARQA